MHAYKIIIYESYTIWTLWTHIDTYIYRIMDARKRSSHGCVLPPAMACFFFTKTREMLCQVSGSAWEILPTWLEHPAFAPSYGNIWSSIYGWKIRTWKSEIIFLYGKKKAGNTAWLWFAENHRTSCRVPKEMIN
jgi:hypothetical protein